MEGKLNFYLRWTALQMRRYVQEYKKSLDKKKRTLLTWSTSMTNVTIQVRYEIEERKMENDMKNYFNGN